MKIFSAIFLFLMLTSAYATTPDNDPFQPLLDDIDKNIAPELSPSLEVKIAKDAKEVRETITGGEENIDGVKVRHVVFKSVPVYKDGAYHDDTMVYAAIATPANLSPTDKVPGILTLHGGGGSALYGGSHDRIVNWAKAGYVAVACDLPGIAGDVATSSSGTWRTVPYGELTTYRFTATPDIKASWIYTAEATALKAFAILKSQPNVDSSKIGILGESWGGYSTTMLCGLLGDRVKAGFSIYGCGFFEEPSAFQIFLIPTSPQSKFKNDPEGMNKWLTYLDAGRRAGNIKCHFYLGAASNDHFFRPPAVNKTLQAITNAQSLHFQFSPNDNHKSSTPGGTHHKTSNPRRSTYKMEEAYFDYLLKGIGAPLPDLAVEGSPSADAQGNLEIKFKMNADPSLSLKEPELYYSLQNEDWPKRKWIKLEATAKKLDGNLYSFSLPKDITTQKVDWFVLVSDITGDRATTVSTQIYPATTP